VEGERGQAAFLMLGALATVTVICWFAVNVGVLVATRSAVQRAADAAVLAGCAELPNVSAAQAKATEYGQTKNSGSGGHFEAGNSVTFPSPQPPSGPLPNDTFQVEVQRAAPIFGGFTLSNGQSRARATCRRDEGPRPALQALGSGSSRLQIHAGANVQLGGTGAIVSSSNTCGLRVDAGASLRGRFFDTPLGVSTCISGSIDPPVQAAPSSTLLNDPFAAVPEPVLGGAIDLAPFTLTVPGNLTANDPRPGCAGTFQGPLNETSPARPNHCHIRVTATIDPGIYWGGLELGSFDGTPTTITLNPGLYFLAGGVGGEQNQGGLWVHPNTTVIGNGVIFFSGSDPYAMTARRCGFLHIYPDATYDVTPPASGVYQGILFFQSRGCLGLTGATAAEIQATIEGSVVGRAGGPKGVLYLQPSEIRFFDTNTLFAIVVADHIQVHDTLTVDAMIGSGTLWHGPLHLIE
jgi:hypothetical protein